jgi:probable O-glycosylation ligase (exosortase A-associated)
MKGLVLIYLVTAFGSIAALRKPAIGLYVYVGFAVLRPQAIFGFAGDMSGISLYVGIATLIGWALNGFGALNLGRGKVIVLALLAFFAWSALSAVQATNTFLAYDSLMTMAKFVMPFFIGVTILDSEQRSKAMLWIIVLAQGYQAFELNLAYVRGYNLAGDGFGGMDNNCLGVALVSTIGPAIALGIGANKWYHRAVAGVCAALILHATLLTFSRGAMVGLLAVGLSAFIIMPKRPKYLAVLTLAVLVAIRLTGPQLMERYASSFSDESERDASAESRLDLWADCLKIANDRPLFGVGPANFQVVSADLGWAEGKQAHSVWMQTAAEVGYPGVLLLFSFFAITVVKLWPLARARQTPENRYQVAVASGIIMSIAGFAIGGQFVSLGGLEIPYYTAMIGAVLIKAAAVKPAAIAVDATRSVGNASAAPRAPRPVRPAVGVARTAPVQRT